MYTSVGKVGQVARSISPIIFSKQVVAHKSDYHFVDFIRFVSIIGIVSIHSTFLPKGVSLNEYLHQISSPEIYIGFLSLLRFAVISFCIISGYLLAPKITKENRFSFFCERAIAILKPALVAILITATFIFLKESVTGEQKSIWSLTNSLVFEGVFWFLPMQLLSLLLLMLFIALPRQLWVGITLLASLAGVTAYYVYFKKLAHIDPVFSLGFVFYFWLGTMFFKYKVIEKIKKTRLFFLLAVWLLSFVCLNIETIFLWKNNYPHLLNNLRVTNQVYGITSFFVLVRISDYFNNFSVLNPRKESFGIYLYHRAIGLVLFFILHRVFNLGETFNAFTSITFTIAHFIFTYVVTTLLVKMLIKWEMFFLTNSGQYPKASRILLSLRNSSNIIL